jgi:hypothetical protein
MTDSPPKEEQNLLPERACHEQANGALIAARGHYLPQ